MTSMLSPGFERTLCLIKPNAVANNTYGAILETIQQHDLTITLVVRRTLTPAEAEDFYAEHRGKRFFHDLITGMCSGPLLVVMLDGQHAVSRLRTLMGPADLTQAAPDTLRARFATEGSTNSIHGSDSAHAAAREYAILFPPQQPPLLEQIA
ncbi:MAG: nucleoside-diphosphate kinase [Nitrospirota bacterium]|nr:nucleoside-diphosphate kinase [Nitrospirota bacterium]